MTPAAIAAPTEGLLPFIAKPTPQLRTAIERFEAALSPADFADLCADVRSAFDKSTAKLLEFRAGAERGTALHDMMDRELKAAAAVPVSCRQGCSGCCHYEVEITHDEAEILKEVVRDGFAIDRLRLKEQAARERKSAAWSRLGSPENRCVFLGRTGACQIYRERPAICRKHLVVSPASACTTAGAAVAPVQVLMAEILLSAALSLAGATCASLPKMLHAALQADERRTAHGDRFNRTVARAHPSARAIPAGPAVRPPTI